MINISVQQAEAYAAQAGFSNATVGSSGYTQIQVIVAIAIAESNLDTQAQNLTDPYGGSFGVLQINGVHFNGTFTKTDAFDPLKSFQYAYLLSQRGTNFNPWSTFTNGAYKQHIPIIQQSGITLPSDGWWTFPRYDHIGEPDKYGGFPKPDSNIFVPDGYPVNNILRGRVSGINTPQGSIPDFGATVTILLDTPINDLATHISFLHLKDVTVRQGQVVNVGDIIGHNGGNQAAGSQKVSLGFALYHGNYYGVDGWEYMSAANLAGKLNPVPVIESIASGNGLLVNYNTPGNNQLSSFISNALTTVGNNVSLLPNSDVIAVLYRLDDILTVVNPFGVTSQSNNPLDWLGDFLYVAFVVDVVAFLLRILIFLAAAYMLFMVIRQLTGVNVLRLSNSINTGINGFTGGNGNGGNLPVT